MRGIPEEIEREFHRQVGLNIRGARKARGWKQGELAKVLDIPRTIISRWERGAAKIPLIRVHQIASVLDVSLRALLPARYKKEPIGTSAQDLSCVDSPRC